MTPAEAKAQGYWPLTHRLKPRLPDHRKILDSVLRGFTGEIKAVAVDYPDGTQEIWRNGRKMVFDDHERAAVRRTTRTGRESSFSDAELDRQIRSMNRRCRESEVFYTTEDAGCTRLKDPSFWVDD